MIRAIIVEDSELARLELRELLAGFSFVEVVAEASSGNSAIELINAHNPELVFLDINLPDIDGFGILDAIKFVPQIIFTTAYDEYAIQSFEYNTADYLLKPIKPDRLRTALDKVRKQLPDASHLSLDNRIFIKDNQTFYITFLRDISLFHTEGNYTKVYFKDKSPLMHKSLNQIESGLDPAFFFRINRQQIVNINHIVSIDVWFKGKLKLLLSCNNEVEVSERQSVKLKQKLSF